MTTDAQLMFSATTADPADALGGSPVGVAAVALAAEMRELPADTTIVCLSHLRWDFVYQRPQHIMSRLARRHRVFYVEEPVPTDAPPHLESRTVAPGLEVIVPRLPMAECEAGNRLGEARQRALLAQLIDERGAAARLLLWYYTPMARGITGMLSPQWVVYDCMDELAAFDHPPRGLVTRERELLAEADLVFTGGHSLYESKRRRHPRVHLFPSSVDVAHFRRARTSTHEPVEMRGLAHPRIGFYGVVDERFDTALLGAVAGLRPQWQWVIVGPVVKINPASLPQAPNLHYVGLRSYAELPDYLGSWDVAMMPFALNASTRFISPTKTPEFLAAGRPVVSTPVPDVVRGYGASGLVGIAGNAAAFCEAVAKALDEVAHDRAGFCARADELLHGLSWDRTCERMVALAAALPSRRVHAVRPAVPVVSVPVSVSRERQPVVLGGGMSTT